MSAASALFALGTASLLASFLSACFSVGGGYILFAATTALMPLPNAIALQSALSFGSLFSRTHAFWADIEWPIVRSFSAGSLVGVSAGIWLFRMAPESVLALLLALLLIGLAWLPPLRLGITQGQSFFGVGILHAVVGTLFGLGAILQPALLRTRLERAAIVGTFAACIILLEVLRTCGYAATGFSYWNHATKIAVATVTGLAGTYLGKRAGPFMPDRLFRIAMKIFITGLAARFLFIAAA